MTLRTFELHLPVVWVCSSMHRHGKYDWLQQVATPSSSMIFVHGLDIVFPLTFANGRKRLPIILDLGCDLGCLSCFIVMHASLRSILTS